MAGDEAGLTRVNLGPGDGLRVGQVPPTLPHLPDGIMYRPEAEAPGTGPGH